MLRVIEEQVPPPTRYVHIADYTDLIGASTRAKKHFLRTLSQRPRIIAMVLFGLSPVIKLMVQLAARLNPDGVTFLMAKDYSDAVQQASQLLAEDEAPPIPDASRC